MWHRRSGLGLLCSKLETVAAVSFEDGGKVKADGRYDGSMIAHVRGLLLTKSPNRAVVECAGVGYDVAISVATFSALPAEGAQAKLHIYTRVAEDQLALYGFAELTEKRIFEKLLMISGIGPKLAITVLSGIDAARLVEAIRGGDHASLVRIPGIGKKTAERVVLELKDKLDDLAAAPVEAARGVEHGTGRGRRAFGADEPGIPEAGGAEGDRDGDCSREPGAKG